MKISTAPKNYYRMLADQLEADCLALKGSPSVAAHCGKAALAIRNLEDEIEAIYLERQEVEMSDMVFDYPEDY